MLRWRQGEAEAVPAQDLLFAVRVEAAAVIDVPERARSRAYFGGCIYTHLV
jgi:hypothetical protein